MANPTLQTMINKLKELEGEFIFPKMNLSHYEKEEDGEKYIVFTFTAPKKYNAAFVLPLNISDKSKEERETMRAQICWGVVNYYSRAFALKWEEHPEHERVMSEEENKNKQ